MEAPPVNRKGGENGVFPALDGGMAPRLTAFCLLLVAATAIGAFWALRLAMV